MMDFFLFSVFLGQIFEGVLFGICFLKISKYFIKFQVKFVNSKFFSLSKFFLFYYFFEIFGFTNQIHLFSIFGFLFHSKDTHSFTSTLCKRILCTFNFFSFVYLSDRYFSVYTAKFYTSAFGHYRQSQMKRQRCLRRYPIQLQLKGKFQHPGWLAQSRN